MDKQAIIKREFPSGSSNAIYETIRWTDGTYSCNCPGWTRRTLKGDAAAKLGLPEGSRFCTHVGQMSKDQKPAVVKPTQPAQKKSTPITELTTAMPEFFKPMLAQTPDGLDLKTLLVSPHFVAEPKLDGKRALVFIRNFKTAAAYSRLGNDMRSYNGCTWLREIKWPVKSAVLDGELCSMSGIWRAGKEVSKARSTAGQPQRLVAFDLLELNGTDVKAALLTDRRALLDGAFGDFKNEHFAVVPQSDDAGEMWQQWVETFGGEGIMLKTRTSHYVPGWRSPHWFKIKLTITVDVVVMGVSTKPSNAQSYKTGECSLVYGWWDPKAKKLVESGQGIKIGSKAALSEHVGKVAEMKCWGVTHSGALTSGQFLRWRDDKAPEECVAPGTAVTKVKG